MQEESLVIRLYGNSPQMRIVDFLMEFPINEFTTSELVEHVGMSKTTIYKQVSNLHEQGMVKINKEGKGLIFSIDMDNPIIQTIKTGVSIASGKIAQKELANEKFLMRIRKSVRTRKALVARKTLLKTELTYTTKTLQTMPEIKVNA